MTLGSVAAVGLVIGAVTWGIASIPQLSGVYEPPKVAVATDNPRATSVAMRVLRAGGDAVDAAVSAAFVLGVVSPTASGIGGGGFAVVYRAKTHEVYVLDFRETAPASIDESAFSARKFPGGELPEGKRGAFVGVPGEVAGLAKLVSRYGHRTFAQDVWPAIHAAEEGFEVSHYLHRLGDPSNTAIPAPVKNAFLEMAFSLGLAKTQGGPLLEKERARREQLGRTLRAIADGGPNAFYQGEVAEKFVSAAQAAGGTITMDDMAAYVPIERTPLRMSFGDHEIVTMPPPSAGGVMLLQAFIANELWRAKEGKGFDRDGFESARYLHRLAEVLRGSFDDRARFIGDPEQVASSKDVSNLLSDAWMQARLAKITDGATHPQAALRVDEHGTTHISIVDDDGDAVALTTTHNDLFGARILAGDTGVLLNDELNDFAMPGDGPNAPRPEARPTSSMTPTLILDHDGVRAVLGGSGGMKIGPSVTEVALAREVFGIPAKEAVRAARIYPTPDGKLVVEPDLDASIRDALKGVGENVDVTNFNINAVQVVFVDGAWDERTLSAAADPRKNGLSLAE